MNSLDGKMKPAAPRARWTRMADRIRHWLRRHRKPASALGIVS